MHTNYYENLLHHTIAKEALEKAKAKEAREKTLGAKYVRKKDEYGKISYVLQKPSK